LPQTYIEIEEELNKENFAIKNISDIVHKDMAIATRILQVVNSPLFGLAKNITDIQQAISLLGITMLKSLILYTQIFRSFEGNMRVENIQKEIWEHSLKVANTSKLLVANFGNRNEIETAFISGLLHDVGKIIIINNEKFIFDILELMKSENIEYNEAEYKILGTSHAEIGAYLLSLWGLPNIIVNSVKNHHKISKIENNIISVETAVFIANEYNSNLILDSKLFMDNGFENLMPQILSICC
jgi:putative nucleotidyltransferase with HDIG domain